MFHPRLLLPLLIGLLVLPELAQTQATQRHYLSGTDKDHTVDWEILFSGGRHGGEWTTIAVPSVWEQQGFGNYTYGHDAMKGPREEGRYRHNFRADRAWRDGHVFLVFEGVMTDAEVQLNGRPAGPVHQGGFYRFRYDVTDLLRYGADNRLEVTVRKQSADPSVNRAELEADYWAFGGVFRPVYLEIVPQHYLERVAVDARADGSLALEIFPGSVADGHRLEVQLETLNGEPVGGRLSALMRGGAEPVRLEGALANVQPWSAEFPNLYRLRVHLVNDLGAVVHTLTERFGFRTVELRPRDGFYVNGRRVIFRGVNRHSFWPESGRTLSREVHLADIQLMKEMNMNAVRMSHYPPDVEFLDLCDSLGLYVLDELAGWQASYDTTVGRRLVRETVIRDVNHPSVVAWNNGNEGGWNRALDGDFHRYDPQRRPVLHPWERFNDTDTKHYPDFKLVTDAALYGQEVFFPTELQHGLYDGGHGAALEDFWNRMMTHPAAAGGFLWVLRDEGIARTDQDGKLDVHGTNAPDGIVGPYGEKEGSFYTIREIWSPVQIRQRRIGPGFDGRLAVENHYSFTGLEQVKFEWRLVRFPGPEASDIQPNVTATGRPQPLRLSPGETGHLNLSLPSGWAENDALYLTATDPHGRELFTWSWPLRGAAVMAAEIPVRAADQLLGVREQGQSLEVVSAGVTYTFDTGTGYLQKVSNGQSNISLSNGPRLAGVDLPLTEFKHYEADGARVVEARYAGTERGNYFNVKWTFAPGHPARLYYQYGLRGEHDFFGITFQYPEEKVRGMKWLGRGPYRVWKNRIKGPAFGLWQKEYNDAVTGEVWQYPEFKGYHADLYWVQLQTDEAPFTIHTQTDGLFLQMLRPRAPAEAFNENTNPPFPEADIGILHAISPIGTKFQSADKMGPQSQRNVTWTPLEGEVMLDFRPIPMVLKNQGNGK